MICTNSFVSSKKWGESDKRGKNVHHDGMSVLYSVSFFRVAKNVILRVFLLMTILLMQFMLISPLSVNAAITGNITGRIVDADGIPLKKVRVRASGTAFPGYREAYSQRSGRYTLVLLPPGVYSIEAELSGMKTIVKQNVRIRLNEIARVNFTMEISDNPEAVDLVIISPEIETLSHNGKINIPTELIQRLPNYSHLCQVFTMGGGTTDEKTGFFYGSTPVDNLYLVDGVDVTDPVTHMFHSNLNPDSVDTVQVQTGGFSAEYGRALGGVVNAITRSGGNEFEGSFRLKFSSESLNAQSKYNEQTGQDGDYFEPIITLGGPIVKDNLWFFLNYQQHRFDQTYRLDDYHDSASETNYDPDLLSDKFWEIFGGKLTWALGTRFNMEVFYSGAAADFDNTTDGAYQSEAKSVWDIGEEHYGISLRLIPKSTYYITSTVGVLENVFSVQPQDDSGVSAVYDPLNNTWYNNYPYQDKTIRKRTSASLAITQTKDDWRGFQEFTLGVEHQILEEQRDFSYTTNRYYEIDGYGTDNQAPYRRLTFNDPQIEMDQCDYWAVFAVESWDMYKNFTLTPSIRWENSRFKNKDGTVVHTFNRMFAPRLAFSWDIFNRGKTELYGSVGRYYNPYDLTLISMNPGEQQIIEDWRYDPNNSGADEEGYYYYQNISGSEGDLIDEKIKPESTDEYILGFDTEIIEHWAAGARFQYKQTRDIIEDVGFWEDDQGNLHLATDVDTSDPQAVQTWYDNWQEHRYIATNPPDAYRDYLAYEFHSTVRTEKWWLEVSYTYSQYKGTHLTRYADDQVKDSHNHFTAYFDTPLLSSNIDGPLTYDIPHNVKAYAVYYLPWKMSIGTRLLFRSGYVYDKFGNFSAGEDGIYGNADDIDHRDPAYGGGLTLPEGRGQYRLPDIFIVDLSLQKDFDFGNWGLLTGIVDVTNMLDNQTVISRNETEGPDFGTDEEWLSPRMISFQLKYSF